MEEVESELVANSSWSVNHPFALANYAYSALFGLFYSDFVPIHIDQKFRFLANGFLVSLTF